MANLVVNFRVSYITKTQLKLFPIITRASFATMGMRGKLFSTRADPFWRGLSQFTQRENRRFMLQIATCSCTLQILIFSLLFFLQKNEQFCGYDDFCGLFETTTKLDYFLANFIVNFLFFNAKVQNGNILC